jgi:L-lactate dehydrogenase complex protein LldE
MPRLAETVSMPATATSPRVALFVTCLVDLFRPSVGFATVKLLEAAGCTVEVPTSQTCCGQPAYNSGDKRTAEALARQTIEACEGFDYVVAPSGSCAGMLKAHYPKLLADDPDWRERARAFSEKVHELVSFLVDVRGLQSVDQMLSARATYHDSCSGLRELGIKDQPRKLLASVEGLEIVEMADCEVCCGFGGTFSVKYGDISGAIVDEKCRNIRATGCSAVVLGDLGCILNIEGRLRRSGDDRTRVLHVAQVLAGDA